MKPKIFVSSTYYDLKLVRENIEKFLNNMGFDSILFESGDITFEHDTPLDSSCYREVKNSNMLLLLVGGRYGSKASNAAFEDFTSKYEKYYTSITKKEFLTAQERGIPIYVFVDCNVMTEYETYKKNKDLFCKLDKKISFAHVDSINVFIFLDDLYSSGLPIFRFTRYDEIEKQFIAQISGLLHLYLEGLVNKSSTDKVSDSVDNLISVTERMEKMLQKVGEKVYEHDSEGLNVLKMEQNQSLITFCTRKMGEQIIIVGKEDQEDIYWIQLSDLILNHYLLTPDLWECKKLGYRADAKLKLIDIRSSISEKIANYIKKSDFILSDIKFDKLEEMTEGIVEIVRDSEENKKIVRDMFARALEDNCLPF